MKGTVRVVFFQGLTYVLQVAFVLLAARFLGPEAQGKYALLRTSVYLLEAFMWFGLTTGIPYFIAKNAERYHDPLLKLSAIYLLVIGTVGYLATGPLSSMAHLDPATGVLAIWWVVTLGASQVLLKVFMGERRYDTYNLATLVGVGVLFVSLFVYFAQRRSLDLGQVLLCHIWSNCAVLAFAAVVHRQPLSRLRLSLRDFDWSVVGDVYAVGGLGYLSSLAFLLLYRLDFFLVGFFLSAKQLGIYAVAVFVVEGVQKVPDWLGMVLAPKVAAGLDEDHHITYRYLAGSICFVGLAALAFLVLNLLRVDIITWLVGDKYQGVNEILNWLMPRAILHGAMVIFAGNLVGRGYTAYHPLAGFAAACVLLIADYSLIPSLGTRGAAIGITLGYIAATAVMVAGFKRKTRREAPLPEVMA